jgi:estrone sulfotransferase
LTDLSRRRTQWGRILVKRAKPFVPPGMRKMLAPLASWMAPTPIKLGPYELKIEPGDVFLVSFPRSGNTWLRHMLVAVHPALGPSDSRNIWHVSPSLEETAELSTDPSVAPRPRLIKSHRPFDARYPRVIYLLRDGRDAAYSFYIHQRQHGYCGSFRDFLVSGAAYRGCPWHEHVESWLSRNLGSRLLLMRYEEMLANPQFQLRRAVAFLGWCISDDEIQRAVDESAIDRMRNEERSGIYLGHVGHRRRRGWRAHYSDDDLEIFMAAAAATLRRFGYLDR